MKKKRKKVGKVKKVEKKEKEKQKKKRKKTMKNNDKWETMKNNGKKKKNRWKKKKKKGKKKKKKKVKKKKQQQNNKGKRGKMRKKKKAQGMTFCSTLKSCAAHHATVYTMTENKCCALVACGWCVAQTLLQARVANTTSSWRLSALPTAHSSVSSTF